jgi:hypothetical protein
MQAVSSLRCCQIFIRRHGITSHSSQYTSGEHQRCTFRKHNVYSIQFIRVKTTKYLKWLADSHYARSWSFSITIKTTECSEAHSDFYTAGTNGSFQDSKDNKSVKVAIHIHFSFEEYLEFFLPSNKDEFTEIVQSTEPLPNNKCSSVFHEEHKIIGQIWVSCGSVSRCDECQDVGKSEHQTEQ